MQNDTSRKCLRGGARRAALPDLSFGGCAFPPFSCLQRTVPVALSQELCRPPAPARLPAAPPGPAAQRSPTPSPVIDHHTVPGTTHGPPSGTSAHLADPRRSPLISPVASRSPGLEAGPDPASHCRHLAAPLCRNLGSPPLCLPRGLSTSLLPAQCSRVLVPCSTSPGPEFCRLEAEHVLP